VQYQSFRAAWREPQEICYPPEVGLQEHVGKAVFRYDVMTEHGPQNWLYVAAGILCLFPCFLLFFSWWSSFNAKDAPSLPTWRKNVTKMAILVAGVSTLLHFVWNVSWLRAGGNPHGMDQTGPGMWRWLGTPMLWSFGIAVTLGIFAKRDGRIFLVGWTLSMVFAFYMIYALQAE
jgi:hypothetical protein